MTTKDETEGAAGGDPANDRADGGAPVPLGGRRVETAKGDNGWW